MKTKKQQKNPLKTFNKIKTNLGQILNQLDLDTKKKKKIIYIYIYMYVWVCIYYTSVGCF